MLWIPGAQLWPHSKDKTLPAGHLRGRLRRVLC